MRYYVFIIEREVRKTDVRVFQDKAAAVNFAKRMFQQGAVSRVVLAEEIEDWQREYDQR